MSNRGGASEDKRAIILAAAVRVFAREGYHDARVGDIAKEAGVAYGLVYHYFRSKEAVLEAVFRETWGAMLTAIRSVEDRGGPATDQLRRVCAIVLGSWATDPDLIRVLVREVVRSPQIQREIDEIAQAFAALERIIVRGQKEGTFTTELGSRTVAWMLYGALEEILTGWVMGQLPDGEDDVAEAGRVVVAIFTGGLQT
ncbi:MAG: TetR/AcrR family transcriptional regulator, fatty acid metabolism regulator protein [Gaiellaceae bacterium]|nr:TetR/AcrR family transcriptional regulator, fatty acid metabolism regulator protein [Gaiellaceae bacterium]MDX6478391.1 TetR/AcrR family transcriptional regulator, fatty acid metabolism regulator protein [Gaiellaceae bacterium]MDX6483735.1 TetR/AcrR family transcriptional regulator, fatty acid metabolism regulator protein [Gaiellaceae bacterium]MDX6509140.1 TetR/AcrR family transcriptional regulator, fatty acid metabolism regulator protein [Gaiellaceae bacterium]